MYSYLSFILFGKWSDVVCSLTLTGQYCFLLQRKVVNHLKQLDGISSNPPHQICKSALNSSHSYQFFLTILNLAPFLLIPPRPVRLPVFKYHPLLVSQETHDLFPFSIINHFLPISFNFWLFKDILLSPITNKQTNNAKHSFPGPLLAIVSPFFLSITAKPPELSVLNVISPGLSYCVAPSKLIKILPLLVFQRAANKVTNGQCSNISQLFPQPCYVAQWLAAKTFISWPHVCRSIEVQLTRVSLGLIQVICLDQAYSLGLSLGAGIRCLLWLRLGIISLLLPLTFYWPKQVILPCPIVYFTSSGTA